MQTACEYARPDAHTELQMSLGLLSLGQSMRAYEIGINRIPS